MGTCASVQYSKNPATSLSAPSKVIHSIDGRLQEFWQPTKAGTVLSDQSSDSFFLCNAEHMYVNCHVPHVPEDEELQPGQIYFIMPVSKRYRPISLQDLCLLAIKASSVIESVEMKKMTRTTSFSEQMKKMSITTSFSDRMRRTASFSGGGMGRTTSLSGRRKRNGSVKRNRNVDFQLALKQLG